MMCSETSDYLANFLDTLREHKSLLRRNNHREMTGDRKTSVTLTEEEEYSDDESYEWSEDSDSDIDSYLSWEEDSVLSTDDDIDSEEEDSDLDEDMELATKNPQRRTTETLTKKTKKTNCSM